MVATLERPAQRGREREREKPDTDKLALGKAAAAERFRALVRRRGLFRRLV